MSQFHLKNLILAACALTMISGCGGGSGGSGQPPAYPGGYNVSAVNGVLVGDITASKTAQSVTLDVNGVTRKFDNVIVGQSGMNGTSVTILLAQSQLFFYKCDPGSTALISGTSIGVPVDQQGQLISSVIGGGATLSEVKLKYSVTASFAADFPGYTTADLPNGYTFDLVGSHQGDLNIKGPLFPVSTTSVNTVNTGTYDSTSTSPSGSNLSLVMSATSDTTNKYLKETETATAGNWKGLSTYETLNIPNSFGYVQETISF